MPNAAGMAEVRGIAMSGDTLVLAGAFGGVNGASATNVASLHGNNWTQLGTGLPDGDVRCLSRFGTNVYLCGAFKVLENGISTNAAILTLVSNQWVNSLSAIATVADLLVWRGPDLFALGDLNDHLHPSSNNARIIWQFDGQRWAPLNNGLTASESFYRLAAVPQGIVLGRIPTTGGSNPVLWDGGRLIPLNAAIATNSGTLAIRHDVAAIDNVAYIHGTLLQTNGVTTNILARWENGVWIQATAPMPVAVSALAGEGGIIYVGGRIAGGGGVYRWVGSEWTELGGTFTSSNGGINGSISALTLYKGRVFVGGGFTMIAGAPVTSLAFWDGQQWIANGSFDGGINDLTVAGGRLYAVGTFTNVSGITANGVAIWDGSNWSTFGHGLPGVKPACVAATDDGLVAIGGAFNGAQGVMTTNIILWRRDHWGALGNGFFNLDAPPAFLLWRGYDLYVTGSFLSVDGLAESGFAIWHENGALLEAKDAGSALELSASGAVPADFRIETTADLTSWSPVATNSLGNPGTVWSLPTAERASFYRLRSTTF